MSIAAGFVRRAGEFPPGPSARRRFFSGEFRRQSIPEFLQANHERYGDFVHWRWLGHHIFQMSSPELIQELFLTHAKKVHRSRTMQRAKIALGSGMLTSEPPHHLRQRRLAQPAFHRERIAGYARATVDQTLMMLAGWRDGSVVDFHQEMLALTLRVVGKTLFDVELEQDVKKVAGAAEALVEFMPLTILPFPGLIERLPLPQMIGVRKAVEDLNDLIYQLIRERRADNTDHGDLLSMLLAAVDEEGSGSMTDQQVRDEAMTILLAGHETTANALSFACWLLARHPKTQEQLFDEVAAVLEGRIATAADYPQLKLAEKVFAETLRLYPPVWVTGRVVAEPFEVRGARLPKGSWILAPQIVVQRDPAYFSDPLRFDPSRFTEEAKATRHRFSYFPFGGGSRQCIGEGFAWMEGVLVLSAIVQKWQLLPTSNAELKTRALVTLRPEKGVPLMLRARA